MKRLSFFPLLLAGFIAFAAAGCQNATGPVQDDSLLATIDAAEVIAGAIGSDNGGLHDQLTDIVELSLDGVLGLVAVPDEPNLMDNRPGPMLSRGGVVRRREYDPNTQTWTITVQRTMNSPVVQGSWMRQYRLRFSRNGVGQQFFRTNNQYADLVTFEIVPDSCSGSFKSPRISHRLTRLEGAVRGTISVADTANPIMTINSTAPYRRAAIDSLKIGEALRVSNHTVTATLRDVVVPLSRARRFQNIYARATSGTISGTYTANITFVRGEQYEESQVNREFTIDLSQERNGRLPLSLRGRRGEFRGFFEWVPGLFMR
ncbi:MAG: hypothetical protein RMI34_10455 [Chloroherpetonaceae bacterium]|nr:hypothetical protein [Chloroherpetonaceae bacterium]MDW8020482.1 hypothetical protein [Chloroherpetonaceae bacterium]